MWCPFTPVEKCHIRTPIKKKTDYGLYLCKLEGDPVRISICFSLWDWLVNKTHEKIAD